MNPKSILFPLLGVSVTLSSGSVYAQTVPVTNDSATAAPSAAATDAAPHRLTRAPRPKRIVAAELPEGTPLPPSGSVVELDISIDEQGIVQDATVTSGLGPPYDEAAVATLRKFEFEPALMDDVPSGVRVGYKFDFQAALAAAAAAAAPVVVPTLLEGQVRNRKTGQPMVDVTVELDTGASVKTDAQGKFVFAEVPPGKHAVWLSGRGLTPVGTEEQLEPGARVRATYDVELPEATATPDELSDFELVVFAPRLDRTVASTSVSSEQGAKVAGTGGDVVKVVENLPGVARSTVGSGALVVWGASAQDTRTYVDGVHIPVLYHEGGFRSVIHSDLVRSVELQPGGYGASYGRGLGGLVTVGLKSLDPEGYHGSVSADVIDAAASVRGSAGKHWRFAAAGRRSHLDWMLGQVTSEDPGAFVPIPKYWDGQARLAYVLSPGRSIELGGLASGDKISRIRASSDPAETRSETRDSGFQRLYARYSYDQSDGSSTRITPWVGIDRSSLANVVGVVPASQSIHSTLYGARAEWQGPVTPSIFLSAGLDAEVVSARVERLGSVTSPPREGDLRVFGMSPGTSINADNWRTTTAAIAPFAQADFALFSDRVHVIPGVRIEPVVSQTSRVAPPSGELPAVGQQRLDAPLQPRLALRWQVSKRLTAKAAYGVYHQPPFAEDQSSVFGNPRLGLGHAVHYLAGGNFQFLEGLSAEATGFLSQSDHLVVRSPLAYPVAAQALVEDGKGRAYGAQVLLRRDPVGRFFGWVSFSAIRSERFDPLTQAWRRFDFDQSYVFTAVGSYDLGRGFDVGGRFRFATGYPRTPVTGATYDARSDSYQPTFGPINSTQLPNFYQVDVRLAKRFTLRGETRAEVYLDVQNLTNHSNREEIVYSYNYSNKSYITGLPLLPVIGGKLSW